VHRSRVFATYLDVTSTAICCTPDGVEYNWIFAERALQSLGLIRGQGDPG
jgi:hypothetical protein